MPNIQKVEQFVSKYSATQNGTIVPICQRSSVSIPGTVLTTYNDKILSLRAYAGINSVEETPLPDIGFEDTESQKLQKILDLEWQSPRLQLNLYIGDGTDWVLLGSISLLNPMGYPYRYYNLLDLYTDATEACIGDNYYLGYEVENVGHGSFTAGIDTLSVHAEIQRTIHYISGCEG